MWDILLEMRGQFPWFTEDGEWFLHFRYSGMQNYWWLVIYPQDTPTLDTYLRIKYITLGGVHKPPLIWTAALQGVLNKMYAFLMEKAKGNSLTWIPNQALLVYAPARLMWQDCLHCPRPSSGQADYLHCVFILHLSMLHWGQCFWGAVMKQ